MSLFGYSVDLAKVFKQAIELLNNMIKLLEAEVDVTLYVNEFACFRDKPCEQLVYAGMPSKESFALIYEDNYSKLSRQLFFQAKQGEIKVCRGQFGGIIEKIAVEYVSPEAITLRRIGGK